MGQNIEASWDKIYQQHEKKYRGSRRQNIEVAWDKIYQQHEKKYRGSRRQNIEVAWGKILRVEWDNMYVEVA